MTEATVMIVTPEMANEWLMNKRYEHQRNVRQYQVKFLAEEMRRGLFKQDTPIEFCIIGGSEHLTDGQHRLSALVLCGIPQRFVVIKRIMDSEESAALDYTRTDKNILRTIAEDYKTLSLETELGLTATQVNNLGVAAMFIARNFSKTTSGNTKLHPDDRLKLMREYNQAYATYLEVIAGCRREMRHRLERGATLSVALVTFRYSTVVYGSSKVEEFWSGVAMDDGLLQRDPRKRAHLHLLEYGMIGGTGTTKKSSSPAFSARYLATCFNAYLIGRTMVFTRPDTQKPIVILGSPWKS